MSNSVRAHERRRERALQCQYENRMHRNAIRNTHRLIKSPVPELKVEPKEIKNSWLSNLISRILRRKDEKIDSMVKEPIQQKESN